MRSRVLVSVVGVPLILVVVLWAPEWVMAVLLMLLSAIAAWELTTCVGVKKGSPLQSMAMLGAAYAVAAAWVPEKLYPELVAVIVLLVFAFAVWKGGAVKFSHICGALLAIFAIPYAFSAFLRLHDMGLHRAYLLLPLIFSFCSDTGAFFVGCAFGRHKLAPRVSPHKTVEGAVGGLLGNAVGAVIFGLVLNLGLKESLDLPGLVVLGLICSVVAQLGDLSFSLIKREFGIKDYGRIFLEHGGVLDRFDSVIFVAPMLTALLPWLL